LSVMLFVGLSFGITLGAAAGFYVELAAALYFGLVTGLFFALLSGLLVGIVGLSCKLFNMQTGVEKTKNPVLHKIWELVLAPRPYKDLVSNISGLQIQATIKPNQGILRSLQKGLFYGYMSGLLLMVFGTLLGGLILGPYIGISIGVFAGVCFGLFVGYEEGGNVVLWHYTLRGILFHNGSLPFSDLIPFLDYCAERILLRKVGGGYIFIHRMLMEYFASLDTQSPDMSEQEHNAPPSR